VINFEERRFESDPEAKVGGRRLGKQISLLFFP